MFNLQGSEIIFILLIALVVLGPEKLPDAVKRFTRTYNELRKMGSGLQSELRSALEEPSKQIRVTASLLEDAASPDLFGADGLPGDEAAFYDAPTTARERQAGDDRPADGVKRASPPATGGSPAPFDGSPDADEPARRPAATDGPPDTPGGSVGVTESAHEAGSDTGDMTGTPGTSRADALGTGPTDGSADPRPTPSMPARNSADLASRAEAIERARRASERRESAADGAGEAAADVMADGAPDGATRA